MTRIKEIKFDKKNSFDFHDKNEKMDKNMSKYVTTTENIDNKSDLNDLSQSSNKFNLKDIDNDIIIKNEQNQKTIETKEQIKEIANHKMPDLNAANIETAMKMIAGTARSMGIEVVD